MAFVKVASVNDVKPGAGKIISIGEKKLALFNVDGKFYAIDNRCAHKAFSLGEGELDGSVVQCPGHGLLYDVRTGKTVEGSWSTDYKVNSYPTKVEGNDVLVDV